MDRLSADSICNLTEENFTHCQYDWDSIEPRIQTKYLVLLWNNNQIAYILFGWLSCLIGGLGLVGNTLTLLVLSRKSMRSSPVNKLLITLTVWDIIVIPSFIYCFNCVKAASKLFTHDEKYEFQWLSIFPYIYPVNLTCKSIGQSIVGILILYIQHNLNYLCSNNSFNAYHAHCNLREVSLW